MITQARPTAQCAAALMTHVPAVIRSLRAELRQHGQPHFSLSQLRVLYFLNRQPHSSLSEVADYLDVTRPTMSAMVDRLVQRGLVQRIDDPHERRRVALSLTPIGSDALEQVYGATLFSVEQRLNRLDEEQLSQVMVGLSILGELFSDS
ncbi:MarR family winged helix-turn-helix transcriptional regulator [Leptolyngbya sp. AN02str]|uniref:MarR family winged helix-turn-helix transcriptional regulator n=1 Tax=Leptolyngbya sp. AN02str TaxID=3423363 RepID=UPI003D31FFB1